VSAATADSLSRHSHYFFHFRSFLGQHLSLGVCVGVWVLCVPSCAIVDTHRTYSHVHVRRRLFFDTAAAAGLKRSICAANRYRRRPVIYTLTWDDGIWIIPSQTSRI